MAAREELPPTVRRWRELVDAARLRCAHCDASWLDGRERWRLVPAEGHAGTEHVLLCPTCAA